MYICSERRQHARALKKALATVLGKRVFVVPRLNPERIAHEMVKRLPNIRCKGKEACVADFSDVHEDTIAKCVNLLLHLRNRDELLWTGGFLAIMPSHRAVTELLNADLFGSGSDSRTCYRHYANTQKALAPPLGLSSLVSSLSSLKRFLHRHWQAEMTRGPAHSVRCLAREAERRLNEDRPDWQEPFYLMLEGFRHVKWLTLMPPHTYVTERQLVVMITRKSRVVDRERAAELLRHADRVFKAAGLPRRT